MAALILLAPPSLAFCGAFRGAVARSRIIPCRSRSKKKNRRLPSQSCVSSHHPFTSSHRSLAIIRGGDQQRTFSLGGSASSTANARSSISLPESFEERKEDVTIALRSVFAACRVTRHVQPTSSNGIDVISKQDASPVTIGDFSSQALTLQILHDNFPTDMMIAEEGSDALQKEEDLLNKVCEATGHVHVRFSDKDLLLRAIDYGQGVDEHGKLQSTTAKRRVWCLDPIDGTKGFLRGRLEGGQYCIALALIEDGEPVLSVLGCPNLPLPSTPATTTTPYGLWSNKEVQEAEEQYPSSVFSSTRGCMFVAVRGCGCYEVPLHAIDNMLSHNAKENHESITYDSSSSSSWTQLHVTPNDGTTSKPLHQAKFCLGVERGFSDPNGTILKIAKMIHGPDALTAPQYDDGVQDIKNSLRMDGQGKYGLLSRGDAECFLRLPKEGYIDWVWDVAPGYLILKEAGGTMTDVRGRPIDFSDIGGAERRAKLPDHVKGILGSCGGVFHDALVEAHAEVEQIL